MLRAATVETETTAIENETSSVPSSFSYTKLPQNADVLLHVGSFLNQKDFASTKQALGHQLEDKEAKGLLHNANAFHKVSKAGKLLKATEYADYDQVEHLITNNPSLMFEPVSFKFRD